MSFYFGSYLLDLVAVVTTAVALGYAYFAWRYQYWKKRNVPYLEPVMPWGNLQSPISRTVSLADEIADTYQQGKARGSKYLGIYIMSTPNLFLIDLDLIKNVMTKDFHNFVNRGIYTNEKDDPLTGHLFSLSGTKWRNLRTKLSPTFTSGKMKYMFGTLVECGKVLSKYTEQFVGANEGVDIKDVLGNFSTDIIGSCAFGLECNSFNDPNTPFRVYGRKFFQRSVFTTVKSTFANNFPSIARSLRVTIIPRNISDFFRKVVTDTITYRQKNNYARKDFLQLLIEIMNNNKAEEEEYKGTGQTLTMDEAAAQSFVFFIAGFETSSTTMTFALYLLAQHQDVQDKVRKEITSVLAKHDNQITYDGLNEMKYLKQVIDETLRLYGPVPFLTRVAAEDYKIPGDDMVIEKGTKVIIPIFGIHRDGEYYPNPTKFDPERFSDENKVGRHQYAHIPFGEGPRICIGERFGIMQSKVGLTSILRKYKVTLNKKTQVPLKISTKGFIPEAEGKVWINLEKL